jgi:hypothetical protein
VRKFPTPIENVVLDIAFELIGESRIKTRKKDEYRQIAERLCRIPLKVLHGQINDRLSEIEAKGDAPYEICRFKAGDQYYKYEPFPVSVSLETVRNALTVVGMRKKRGRRNHI